MSKLTEQLRTLLAVPSPQLEALAARRATVARAAAAATAASEAARAAAVEPPHIDPPRIAVISCMLPTAASPVAAMSTRQPPAPPDGDPNETALLSTAFVAGPPLPFDPGAPRPLASWAAGAAEAPSSPPPARPDGDATSTTATAVECLAGDVLPFAPSVPAGRVPQEGELSVEQYAMFCAELGRAGEAGHAPDAVFHTYGFGDRAAVTALHERWAVRFDAAPALRERWLRLRADFSRSLQHHATHGRNLACPST